MSYITGKDDPLELSQNVSLANKIFHLNITEASELITIDMWHEGFFPEISELESIDDDGCPSGLSPALHEHANKIAKQLANAVDSEKLEAQNVLRDFDEKLNVDNVQIHFDNLLGWLQKHNYEPGDYFYEWKRDELDIESNLLDQLTYLRTLSQLAPDFVGNLSTLEDWDRPAQEHELNSIPYSNLVVGYKALLIQNQKMRRAYYANGPITSTAQQKPLNIRNKRTLLIIIAALCRRAAIDFSARGASTEIAILTQQMGIDVDDETIRKLLKEIPDAIESRKK